MLFGMIELAMLLAGGAYAYKDYKNGFPKCKRLAGWAGEKIDQIAGTINTPEKKIDRALSDLRGNKNQLEEQIAEVKARSDQFNKSADEALALARLAGQLAQKAITAQGRAVNEGRQKDVEKNDQVFKALIAQMVANEKLAEQYKQAGEDAQKAADTLEEELGRVRIRLTLCEAQADQAKADIAIAGAYGSINRFLVSSSDGVNAQGGLKQLANGALFERNKGKHLLQIRREDPAGQNDITIFLGQLMFPSDVEKAAAEFRERFMLPPPDSKTESAVEN